MHTRPDASTAHGQGDSVGGPARAVIRWLISLLRYALTGVDPVPR